MDIVEPVTPGCHRQRAALAACGPEAVSPVLLAIYYHS